ncbi:MAG: hypothetical protein COA58_02965 [Bacteroidetes bacterium]|nr:MAG: hypothetical protein COA58_02965 [Bacteroidota bacterium]
MKYFLPFVALVVLLSFSTVEQDKGLAKVNQYSSMYIYVDSKPIDDYDIVGVVKARVGITGVSYKDLRDKLLIKAKKMYPHADGIILRMGSSGSVSYGDAIKFKD